MISIRKNNSLRYIITPILIAMTIVNVFPFFNFWLLGAPDAGAATVIIFTADDATYSVPADWNDANNTIEIIGAGGGGAQGTGNGGGGGGAYSITSNVDLPEDGTIRIEVGTGGGAETAGGNSWICNTTTGCADKDAAEVVAWAEGGQTTTNTTAGQPGNEGSGTVTNGGTGGTGTAAGLKDSGGGGGSGSSGGIGKNGGDGDTVGGGEEGGGGGGGAGGASSTAGSIGTADGGNGGWSPIGTVGGIGGSGGGAGANATNAGSGGGGGDDGADGGDGADGDEYTTVGAGGGGGGTGGNDGSSVGGNGGYGGGGGGGETGGSGGGGLIILTYTLAWSGTFTQNDFEWFVDDAGIYLNDVWPPGIMATVSENGIIDNDSIYSPLASGDRVRLQINATIGTEALIADVKSFALQYVLSSSCSTVPDGSWIDVGANDIPNESWGDNNSGMVTYDSGGSDIARGIVESGSAIYVVGEHYGPGVGRDFFITKYDANGDLDLTWGTNNSGSISYDVSTVSTTESAYAITIDSSNNIYVAGKDAPGVGSDSHFYTTKYDANGDLDLTWGTNNSGSISYDSAGGNQVDIAHAITIDSSNNIYVAGEHKPSGSTDSYIAKYDSNGDLDTTWGDGNSGSIESDMNGIDYATAITIDLTGSIYAAGFFKGGIFHIVKYDPNGDLDLTWGINNSGSVSYNSGGFGMFNAITIDSTQAIYAAGVDGSNDWYIAKYDPDGDLDTTWGTNNSGSITYDSGGSDIAFGITIDSSNNIYVTGNAGGDFIVRKYDANGDLLWYPAWRFYDNIELADGDEEAMQISSSDETGLFSESNPSNAIPATGLNNNVEMDWSLQMTSEATPNSSYCFRMTEGDSARTPFDTYTNYPLLKTSPENDANQFLRHGTFFDDQGNKQGMFWAQFGQQTGKRSPSATGDDHTQWMTGYRASSAGSSMLNEWGTSGVVSFVTNGTDDKSGFWDVGMDLDPSGNLYVTGTDIGYDYTIRKYTVSGNLDTTWGDLDSGIIDFSTTGHANAIVASSSIIYVAGYAGSGADYDWNIRKYDENGDICNTGNSNCMGASGWGTSDSGIITYDSGNNGDKATAIAIDANNAIYVAGADAASTPPNLMVRKYNANGDLDTTWGDSNSGYVVGLDSGTVAPATATGVVVNASNEIFISGIMSSGTSEYGFWALKYDVNGDIDTTWGMNNSGSVSYQYSTGNSMAYGIDIDSNDHIYVVGRNDSTDEWIVRRYDENGDLCDSGNTNCTASGWGTSNSGMIEYDPGSGPASTGYGVAVDIDGSIYVSGLKQSAGGGDMDFMVRKYDADGDLDTTWGGNGVVTYDPAGDTEAYNVIINTDGSILVSGHDDDAVTEIVIKYDADGNVVDGLGGHASETTDAQQQDYYNFDFGIPQNDGIIIEGIEVRLEAKNDTTNSDIIVELSYNGGTTYTTTTNTTGNLTTSDVVYTLGGPTDMWGRTWSDTELTNTNFRVRVENNISSGAPTTYLDYISVDVYYRRP